MRSSALRLTCCLLGLAMLGGCQHRHRADVRPVYEYDGQSRSLALTSPRVYSAQLLPSGNDAWYAGRNDRGPSVIVGYESPSYSQAVTYTRDRRYTSGGRVHDRYDQTTRRRTVLESSR